MELYRSGLKVRPTGCAHQRGCPILCMFGKGDGCVCVSECAKQRTTAFYFVWEDIFWLNLPVCCVSLWLNWTVACVCKIIIKGWGEKKKSKRFWYFMERYVEMKFDTVIGWSLWHFMFQYFDFFLKGFYFRGRGGEGRAFGTLILFFFQDAVRDIPSRCQINCVLLRGTGLQLLCVFILREEGERWPIPMDLKMRKTFNKRWFYMSKLQMSLPEALISVPEWTVLDKIGKKSEPAIKQLPNFLLNFNWGKTFSTLESSCNTLVLTAEGSRFKYILKPRSKISKDPWKETWQIFSPNVALGL